MRLILNGDDLGYSPAVNRSILALHAAGWLTSTSLVVNLQFSQDAMALLNASKGPTPGVGIHLNLSKGRPCLAPDRIPTLVKKDGRFWPSVAFFRRWFAGRVSTEQVEAELRAQIDVALENGLSIDHLDSHSHWHIIPALNRLVERLAGTYGIKAVRQSDPRRTLVPRSLWLAARQEQRRIRAVARPDYLLSLHQWLPVWQEPVVSVRSRLARLFEGKHVSVELVLHPGVADDPDFPPDTLPAPRREREVDFIMGGGLTDWLEQMDAELINYHELGQYQEN